MQTTTPFAAALEINGPIITLRQAAILEALAGSDKPATVRGLAARLGLAKPVITRALNTLDDEGMTLRTRDPVNRRSVDISLTAEGRKFIAALSDVFSSNWSAQ